MEVSWNRNVELGTQDVVVFTYELQGFFFERKTQTELRDPRSKVNQNRKLYKDEKTVY